MRHLLAALGLLALAASIAAHAQSSGEPSAAARAGQAVERGVKAAASGVEHGLKTAASAVERGAKVAGAAVERGVKAAASGVERGAKATAEAIDSTGQKLGGRPASGPAR